MTRKRFPMKELIDHIAEANDWKDLRPLLTVLAKRLEKVIAGGELSATDALSIATSVSTIRRFLADLVVVRCDTVRPGLAPSEARTALARFSDLEGRIKELRNDLSRRERRAA